MRPYLGSENNGRGATGSLGGYSVFQALVNSQDFLQGGGDGYESILCSRSNAGMLDRWLRQTSRDDRRSGTRLAFTKFWLLQISTIHILWRSVVQEVAGAADTKCVKALIMNGGKAALNLPARQHTVGSIRLAPICVRKLLTDKTTQQMGRLPSLQYNVHHHHVTYP